MTSKLQGNFSKARLLGRCQGSSFIEVLVAFLVLGLGITSLVAFQGRLTAESSHAKARTEAAAIGASKMDQFRNYKSLSDFDSMASGSDTVGPTGSGADVIVANLNNTYTRTWTITDSGGYKTLDMQVTWPDKGGAVSNNTTISLDTILARIDPVQTIIEVNSSTTTTSTSTTTSTTTTTTSTTTTTQTTSTTTTSATTTTSTSSTSSTSSTTTSSTTTTTALPPYTLTISGSITEYGGTGITHSVSISDGSCTDSGSSYTCTTGNIPGGSSWSGSVSITTNKVVCGTASYAFAGVTTDQTAGFVLGKTAGDCP